MIFRFCFRFCFYFYSYFCPLYKVSYKRPPIQSLLQTMKETGAQPVYISQPLHGSPGTVCFHIADPLKICAVKTDPLPLSFSFHTKEGTARQ